MSQQEKRSPKRELLNYTSAVLLVLSSYYFVDRLLHVNNNVDVEPPKQPTAIYNRDVLMSRTATALSVSGKDNTFQEVDGYTQELFSDVQRNTVILNVENTENGMPRGGTAWLAAVSGSDLYFVTNRHVLGVSTDNDEKQLFNASILHPQTGEYPDTYTTDDIEYAVSQEEDVDLAVIKFNTKSYIPYFYPVALNWEEESLDNSHEKLLMVGYPGLFMRSSTDSAVMAQVGESDHMEGNEWRMQGIVSPGASGSPIVRSVDGKPVIVGVAKASYGAMDINNPTAKNGTWTVINNLKGLSSLLSQLGYEPGKKFEIGR